LIRAAFSVVERSDRAGRPPAALLVAPDGQGQAELTALAALEIATYRGGSTLVVTRNPAPGLQKQLDRWVARLQRHTRGPRPPVRLVDPEATLDTMFERPGIWLADVSALSDVVLDRLRQDEAAPALIDLVVWWNVHECSGVVGTELWAVSRRLARILEANRPDPISVLAFARSAQPDEQLQRFVTQLLPTTFPTDAPFRADVAPEPVRDIHLHVPAPGSARLTEPARGVDDATMRAATASARTGWPSWPNRPPALSDIEWEAFLDAEAHGRQVRDLLPDELSTAMAYVHRFE
jgi:hypothetical protein